MPVAGEVQRVDSVVCLKGFGNGAHQMSATSPPMQQDHGWGVFWACDFCVNPLERVIQRFLHAVLFVTLAETKYF